MFHCIGQGINYAISIFLWITERFYTRIGFFFIGFWTYDVLYKITKQILNEQLVGTTYCIPKEEWISWITIVGEGLAILIAVTIIAGITQFLGEFLENLMEKLRRKQDKKLKFNNLEIGKMIFFVWCLFAVTCALINLINLFEYSILYVLITLILDIALGWFLFIFSIELEPMVLMFILELLPSGSSGSGEAGGTYVVLRIK